MKVYKEIYDFNDERDLNLFTGKSGIYGILHITHGVEEIIYVGQSKHIARRLKEHRQKNALDKVIDNYIASKGKANYYKQMSLYRFIECNKDSLYFVILKETDELDKWEEHYITLFKPEFNYKGVDVPYKKKEEEEKRNA